jgi:hypothetical protein
MGLKPRPWRSDYAAPDDAREVPVAHAPPRPAFCGSCIEERDDLHIATVDGRLRWICTECRDGDLRSGRWSFDEVPPEPARPLPGKGHD